MEKESKKRNLSGKIVSTKMQKTAVVEVKRVKINTRYQKRSMVSSRFLAENPGNSFREGEFVVIEETRPLSRKKRWLIVGRRKKII